jgi:hypothetical protein
MIRLPGVLLHVVPGGTGAVLLTLAAARVITLVLTARGRHHVPL